MALVKKYKNRLHQPHPMNVFQKKLAAFLSSIAEHFGQGGATAAGIAFDENGNLVKAR